METRTIDFTDSINFTEPFLLFLGRQPRFISSPSRLQITRTHLEFTDDGTGLVEHISDSPITERFDLFIGEGHFSTTRPTGSRRHSVKLVKPTGRRKNQPFEVHLTKKYTRLQ